MTIHFSNPDAVHPPLGLYSHTVSVPEGAELLFLSGQLGIGHDGDAVRAARLKYLGAHRPASTAVFVSQLVDPAWFVEVEAVAAKLP